MDAKDIVAVSIMVGVIGMAVGMIVTYGWMTILGTPVNAGFADMAKYMAGGLTTLAGVVLKDWYAKAVK